MSASTFGTISAQPVGTMYADRQALADAGVHRPLQHGISSVKGHSRTLAQTVILSPESAATGRDLSSGG
jgi:hypothetical protein